MMRKQGAKSYFVLTFAWTWLFWIVAAVLSRGSSSQIAEVFHYLGGVGPLVSALYLVYSSSGDRERQDFWRRVLDVRRIKVGWLAVIFLLVPVVMGFSAVMDIILGGRGGELELLISIISHPFRIFTLIFFYLIFGPLPEELGWRGYALDKLQKNLTPRAASLILGLFWALWHLPLFFVEGSYQWGLGIGSVLFYIFMIKIILHSFIYTWIFNHTSRSTLAAVLFHFAVNFYGELYELSIQAQVIEVIIWFIIIMLISYEPLGDRNEV